jgi:hypothetical protein
MSFLAGREAQKVSAQDFDAPRNLEKRTRWALEGDMTKLGCNSALAVVGEGVVMVEYENLSNDVERFQILKRQLLGEIREDWGSEGSGFVVSRALLS